MKMGEKCTLDITSDFGYGDAYAILPVHRLDAVANA